MLEKKQNKITKSITLLDCFVSMDILICVKQAMELASFAVASKFKKREQKMLLRNIKLVTRRVTNGSNEAQKPFVGLTDEEIWKFWWNKPEVPEGEDDSMEAQFVAACRRAIEAAHGITGENNG